MHRESLEDRIEEYWSWLAGVLFLLITTDLITTLYAAAVRGVGAEANPVVGFLLERGIAELVIANLVVTVVVVVLFDRVLSLLRQSVPPFNRLLALVLELWLGVLLSVGLGVFANNLSVIFFGRDLVVGIESVDLLVGPRG